MLQTGSTTSGFISAGQSGKVPLQVGYFLPLENLSCSIAHFGFTDTDFLWLGPRPMVKWDKLLVNKGCYKPLKFTKFLS